MAAVGGALPSESSSDDGGGVAPAGAGLEFSSNIVSRFFFSYLTPLLWKGFRAPLEASDISTMLEPFDGSGSCAARFHSHFSHGGGSSPLAARLRAALLRLVCEDMAAAGVGKLVGDLLGFVQPLAVAGVLSFLEVRRGGGSDALWGAPGAPHMATGYWWFVAACVASLLQNALLHRHHHHSIRAGMHVRSALSVVAFEKALRLPPGARAAFGAGKVQNLGTTDPNAVGMFFWFAHYLWAAPLQLAISMAMLYSYLGWPSFVGLAVLLLLVPLQACLGGRLTAMSKDTAACSDARLKLAAEVFGGIRALKLQGQEGAFGKRLATARAKELAAKWGVLLVGAANAAVSECGPLLASVFALVTYGLTSPAPLTPPQAFAALSLFQILRLPVMILPMLTGQIAAARASLARLTDFLGADEGADYRCEAGAGEAAALRGAVLAWRCGEGSAPRPPPCLRVAALSLPRGKLTAVVGPVGCGKSALLAALLGDITLVAGAVGVEGGARRGGGGGGGCGGKAARLPIAYCEQVPLVLNATLRANILFGEPPDEARLAAAVAAVALGEDLAALPGGLDAEVGERGVTLSGGQKARVALARALYSRARLLLLDDVLSAVDAAVGRALWAGALRGPLGAGRSIVLVTHAVEVLAEADFVVVMGRGGVVLQSGTYAELLAGGGLAPPPPPLPSGDVADVALPVAAQPPQQEAPRPLLLADMIAHLKQREASTASGVHSPALLPSAAAAAVTRAPAPAAAGGAPSVGTAPAAAPAGAGGGRLVKEESRARGAAGLGLFFSYMAEMGGPLLAAVFSSLLLSTAARTAVDWVLAMWSTDALGRPMGWYVGAYLGVSAAAIALTLFNSAAWAGGGLRAARALHDAMLATVLRCPVQYFDVTPTGRLLNVFSNDVGALDKELPTQLASAAGLALRIAATIVVQAIILPWTLLGSVPLAAVYLIVSAVYRANGRELKRLDLSSKSLAAACLSESVGAQATIAAWGAGARFSAALQAALDTNLRAYWASNSANRWLGLTLDWLGSALLLVVIAAAVSAPASSDPGLVGLAVTYSGVVTGMLNWLVRAASDSEALLGSVERARDIAALPVEAPPASAPGRGPPVGWPAAGALRFVGLAARWRPELPLCLQGLDLAVPAGAKVGIVGRTGAGKSSLLMALFRVMEAERGAVWVDDVNIATLGLDELRGALCVVPQDATLFSGTVREALDPLAAHGDGALRDALAGVGLGTTLALDGVVSERGGNLSAGQRQLLCLARALLRGSRVVVLDEATANLDAETDAALQATLRGGLKGATLIVVAHRLATVMDADLVAVMDGGAVVEVGSPAALAQTPDSAFAALLRAKGAE